MIFDRYLDLTVEKIGKWVKFYFLFLYLYFQNIGKKTQKAKRNKSLSQKLKKLQPIEVGR